MAQDQAIVGPALEPLPEKVLSLGDLVSLTFKLFRRHYRLFFKVLLWPSVGCALASRLAIFGFAHWVKIASHSLLAFAPFASHMLVVLVGLVFWFLATWELTLRCCALVRVMLCVDADYKQAYSVLKKRSGSLFFACNVAIAPPSICLFIGMIILLVLVAVASSTPADARIVIGGLVFGVAGFVLTFAVTLSSLFGALLLAIVTLEELAFKQSVNRAWLFMRMRLLRGGSFISLLSAAIILVCVAVFIPFELAESLKPVHQAEQLFSKHAWYVDLVGMISDIPLNIFIFSISFTGYGLFYRDLTLRLEGRDLLARLARFN